MKANPSEFKFIFIVGAPHSSTTILYRMLARDASLAWFSQYSMRGGQIPRRFSLPFYSAINRYGRLLSQPSWEKTPNILSKFIPMPSEANSIWNYLLPTNAPYTDFFSEQNTGDLSAARILDICSRECMDWNKRALIIKLPRLSHAVTLLSSILPASYFIHIVRDGRAVALSNRHKFEQGNKSESDALRASAHYWSVLEKFLIETQESPNITMKTIRYEDFCADVHGNIANLRSFVGLSSSHLESGLPRTLTSTNSRWLGPLKMSEKEVLLGEMQKELSYYGYI